MYLKVWTLLGQQDKADLADITAQKLKLHYLKLPISVFGLCSPQSLPHVVRPNDPKPKIDLKTFYHIEREDLMPNFRSLIKKLIKKNLGLNMLSGRL